MPIKIFAPLRARDRLPSTLVVFQAEPADGRKDWGDGVCDHAVVREALRGLSASGDFKGKRGDLAVAYPARGGLDRLVVAGLGPAKDLDAEALRQAAGSAAGHLQKKEVTAYDALLPALPAGRPGPGEAAQAVTEGVLLGSYDSKVLGTRNGAGKRRPPAVTLRPAAAREMGAVRDGARIGAVTGEASLFARELGNLPGNVVTPRRLADEARKLGRSHRLKVQVFARAALKRMGMGALLGVARGSAEEPQFLVLEHRPRGGGRVPTLVFVGKGITFDSGGISLKPGDRMEEMKFDMSGAGAVLGALRAIAELRLPARVIGLIPATENMPGGRATKPGDVLTGLSGKTIEVINTDAEGRLVLSDALTYAKRYKPDAVVDLATLTGAIVVALGSHAAGLFGTDEKLIERIRAAGEATGERVWPMPLWEIYGKLMESKVADIKNTGGREAGAITAAWFLKEFAEGYPWAHIDIAATAWTTKPGPYTPFGATAFGVRLLVELVRRWRGGT